VKAWGYQLQDINPAEIAANPSFQLIVMDYSSDGTEDTKFTFEEIRAIRESGIKAIAYFSIGEAEDYRFYWKPEWSNTPPAWLGPENPDWPGNYKVRFWHPDWQNIVFEYLDKIIAQGFDGIYLDIVDGFSYWMHENPEQPVADSLMINFIRTMRTYADAQAPGAFFIIPQNPDDILHSSNVTESMRTNFYDAIDAVGVEDVFFPGDLEEDNPFAPDVARLSNLREFRSAGKPVFSIEYLTQTSKQAQYLTEAHSEGFIPYTCTRELNSLCNGIATSVTNHPTPTADNLTVTVSPQPITSDGQIRIACDNAVGVSISLIDIVGRTVQEVHSGLLRQGLQVLPLSTTGLHTGTYFLAVQTNGASSLYPVLILR
jgi:cysteinyl-tRNA synthetase